jgi:Cu(I)-responsive transcriptional regulator
MNISEAARHAGLPAKTIRYYGEIGLVTPPRDPNGYRAFRPRDLQALTFVARARALGFTIEECRALLHLYQDPARASADVKDIARSHLGRIDARLAQLAAMRDTLSGLVDACAGDQRPDCPILKGLAPTA